jgi:hypothetical protein
MLGGEDEPAFGRVRVRRATQISGGFLILRPGLPAGSVLLIYRNRRDSDPRLSLPEWFPPPLSFAGACARSFTTGGSPVGRQYAIGPRHPGSYGFPRGRTLLQEVSIGVWAHGSGEPSIWSSRLSRMSLPFLSIREQSRASYPVGKLPWAASLVATGILSVVCAFR